MFTLREDTHLTGVFKRISSGGNSGSGNSNSGSSSNVRRGWKKSGSSWYYVDENGRKLTGWLLEGGKWYWLNADGTMRTGWLLNESDGFWYYLNTDGSMADGHWVYEKTEVVSRPHGAMYSSDTTPDGYVVEESGAWVK